MKKKKILIFSVIIVLFITSLFLYKDKNDKNKNIVETNDLFTVLEKEKTPFIGNISKVSHIVYSLKVPAKNTRQRFIKLNTDKEKNELNIYYEPIENYEISKSPYDEVNKEIYDKNSLILFYGIENLNKINYYYRKKVSQGELITKDYLFITSRSKEEIRNIYDDFDIIIKDLEKLKETITN